jgi:hypothetical protein
LNPNFRSGLTLGGRLAFDNLKFEPAWAGLNSVLRCKAAPACDVEV